MFARMALGESGGAVGALMVGAMCVVLVAIVGVLMQKGVAPTPSPGTPVVAAPTTPPVPTVSAFAGKDAKAIDAGPITFTDHGDADLYVSTQKRVDVVRSSLADVKPATTDAALDDVLARCTALAPDLATLDREPHAAVREYIAKAKKTCEYDVPVALLKLSTDKAQAARKGGGKAPINECRRGAKLADALKAHHYEDDPVAHPLIANFAALCTT
jgi:hypothetical protein